MSTPLGHALVGLGVAGLASAVPPTRFARGWGWSLAFVGLAVLPDIDHAIQSVFPRFPLRGPTHSYPAAACAAGALCAAAWRLRRDARVWLLLPYAFLACASHPWMDYHTWIWANGVQLYWPFDATYYASGPPGLYRTEGWLWGSPGRLASLLWTDLLRFGPWAAVPWLARWAADAVARRHSRRPEAR